MKKILFSSVVAIAIFTGCTEDKKPTEVKTEAAAKVEAVATEVKEAAAKVEAATTEVKEEAAAKVEAATTEVKEEATENKK